jgi:hypothetical protein
MRLQNFLVTGGQILFSEFVDWALEKNLDLEDDVDIEVYFFTKTRYNLFSDLSRFIN